MKLLKLLLPLILLLASHAWGTCSSTSFSNGWTCVQVATKATTSGTTTTLAYTSSVSTGQLLEIWIGDNSSAGSNTPAISSDTLGNSWAVCPTKVIGSSAGSISCYYAVSIASGSDTVSYSGLTTSGDLIVQSAWTGNASGTPIDVTGSATGTQTQTVSTSSGTTNANDLVCAGFFDFTNNATLAVGTGYTLVSLLGDATSGSALLTECKSVTATNTYSATITGAGTSDKMDDNIQTFKASGGATKTCTMLLMHQGPC